MNQVGMFELLHDTFKFNKKTITMFEAFAGIGSQALAFKKDVEGLGSLQQQYNFDLNVIGISEIDKYAIQSYNAVHGETKNFGSICDIDQLPPGVDIFTYSFPCQDISLAGKGRGLSKGKGTRSGLLWEVERLIKGENKPKVLLMENVKALINEKHRPNFVEWIKELERLGYSNYWKVLNGKDYGIPQNRERVFMVSVLGEWNYTFPSELKLDWILLDMLQDNPKGKYNLLQSSDITAVDEKYFLSDKLIKFFQENTKKQKARGNGFKFDSQDGSKVAKAITTNAGSRMDDNFILMPEATEKGYVEARNGDGVYINRPHQKRGVVQRNKIPTLKTSGADIGVVVEHDHNLRIRKLTPRECWRLMGFDDCSFNKATAVVSNSQLYKQAGNSIIVDVLYYIFKELF